jgi:hypothetical protein
MRGVAEAGSGGGGANDGYRGVATGLVVAAQFEGSLGSSGAMPGIATPSMVLFSGVSPGLAGAERAGGTGSAPFAGPEVVPPGKGAGKGPIGVGVSPIIVR